MTFQELKNQLPNELHSGSKKAAKDKNAYESLVALYQKLKEVRRKLAERGTPEPDVFRNGVDNVRDLIKALKDDKTLDEAGKKYIIGLYDNGIFEANLSKLKESIDKDLTGNDEVLQEELNTLILRAGAGLGFEIFINPPQEFVDDAANVRAKDAEEKLHPKAKIIEDEPGDQRINLINDGPNRAPKHNLSEDEIRSLWNYGQGEQPTALSYIDRIKYDLRLEDYATYSDEKKEKTICSILAARMTVNSVRGDADRLRNRMNKDAFLTQFTKLMQNEDICAFARENFETLVHDMLNGRSHGGIIEDRLKQKALREGTYMNYPERMRPSVLEITEVEKDFLYRRGANLSERECLEHTARIFASRWSIDAERNHVRDLAQKPTNDYNNSLNYLMGNAIFKNFVREHQAEIVRLAGKGGHGGAMEDLFKKHIAGLTNLSGIPENRFMPTVGEHLEALKKKIGSRGFMLLPENEQRAIYKEIFITRMAGQVRPDNSEDRARRLNPATYASAVDALRNNEALDTYIRSAMEHGTLPALALRGHGGELEEHFKDFVKILPADPNLPNRYTGKKVLQVQAGPAQVVSDKNILSAEEHQKSIDETLVDYVNADLKWDVNELFKDANMLKNMAATSMYLEQVRQEAPKKDKGYEKRMLAEEEVNKNIPKIMEQPAFQLMFEKQNIGRTASRMQRGGAVLLQGFAEAQKALDQSKGVKKSFMKDHSKGIDVIEEENEEEIGNENDELSLLK